MSARDSQRSRLYKAERMVSDKGPHLKTVDEIQTTVNAICRSRWFRNRFGKVQIRVKDGRGRRHAGGLGYHYADATVGYITMPKWSRYLLFILHEIGHVVTPYGVADHGREFARIFLQLVRWRMGTEAASELQAAYQSCRVRHRARVKRKQR